MTTLEVADHVAVANRLHDARLSATPTNLITSAFPDLAWADARAIARRSDRLRLDDGETQIGWKLGWTSQAMRDALGIEHPNWGTLWNSQVCDVALPLHGFIHPKVEPELVWRSPVDLAGHVSADDIQRAGGSWALGIEVVDPRFPSYDFDALDNTADNSSSAAVRIGNFVELGGDPSQIAVDYSDGTEHRQGSGNQTMGSPWEAIAWLVRSLHDEALHLRAGDIVFTGGLTAPFDAKRGGTYELSADGVLEGTTLRFD